MQKEVAALVPQAGRFEVAVARAASGAYTPYGREQNEKSLFFGFVRARKRQDFCK